MLARSSMLSGLWNLFIFKYKYHSCYKNCVYLCVSSGKSMVVNKKNVTGNYTQLHFIIIILHNNNNNTS